MWLTCLVLVICLCGQLIEIVEEDPKAVAVIPTPYLYEMMENYDKDFKSINIPNSELDQVKLQ